MTLSLSDLDAAYRKAVQVSDRLRRADYALREAVRLASKAGFNTTELEANLEALQDTRNLARVKRSLARDAWHDEGKKKIFEAQAQLEAQSAATVITE